MRSSENLDSSRFSEIASTLYLGIAKKWVKKRFPRVEFPRGQHNTLLWAAVCPRPAGLADLYNYHEPEELIHYNYKTTKFTSGSTGSRVPVRVETISSFHSYPTVSEGQPMFLKSREDLIPQE